MKRAAAYHRAPEKWGNPFFPHAETQGGVAAAQRGVLVGGGNQVVIPKVDESWTMKP